MDNRLINVLLVEDNPGDAFSIQVMLQDSSSLQISFNHVTQLKSAIQALENHNFDVAILDLSLPDSYGLDSLLALHNHAPHIPIVVLTGLSDEDTAIQAVQQGAQDYLVKNQISEPILSRSIRYAIERQRIEHALKQRTLQLEAANQELEMRTVQLEQANQALEERTIQLEAANHELEAFNYTVSHDLKNPLTVINGMATLLQMKYASQWDELARSQIDTICQSGRRMSELINDLLQLSQMSHRALRLQPVNLSSLVEAIMETQKQRHPDRPMKTRIAADVIVQGDPDLLRIMLENVLDNAWKYTRERQDAEIQFGVISQIHYPKKLSPCVSPPPNKVICYLRDNGVGFDMEKANKLFTPFQRFHSPQEFEGTGIGLATVKRIIHLHKGEIWIEAAVNQGATVYFVLNRASSAVPHSS